MHRNQALPSRGAGLGYLPESKHLRTAVAIVEQGFQELLLALLIYSFFRLHELDPQDAAELLEVTQELAARGGAA